MAADQTTPRLLIEGPKKAKWTVALAHGAGAGMRNEFMDTFAAGLVEQRFRVVRFEFPYMEQRHVTGSKRPPDREPVLRAAWQSVIDQYPADRLVIGGKSLGGRIASLMADEAGVAGLVCLGYPFHPSGKPDRLRIEHLEHLRTPALFVQGEWDTFGDREEVATYPLSDAIRLHWAAEGDHSLSPKKTSAHTREDNWQRAIKGICRFIEGLAPPE